MKNGFTRKVQLLALFCLVLTGVLLFPEHTAYAANPTAIKIASVEYYEEQIILFNNSNTKIMYATETEAAKDNWEVVNADEGMFTVVDISWLSPSVENILVFKGADDPTGTQSRVIIGDKPLKLEISINYEKLDDLNPGDNIAELVNIMASAGTGENPINYYDLEWRKGASGQWQTTYTLTAGLIEKYLVKGTYLYFRIKAMDDYVPLYYDYAIPKYVDLNEDRLYGILGGIRNYENETGIVFGTDYPDGTDGRRFSNEVKLKIAKKSMAMVYGIDGEKFTAEIRYGKEYRVIVNGLLQDWVKVTDKSIKTLPLSTIIKSATQDGTTAAKAFPAMKIEIRDYATSKAASSKITEIYLKAQRTIDNAIIVGEAPIDAIMTGDENIYVSYNGNKNMIIEIPTATPELPYEYCVVKNGQTFDVNRVVWTSITKGTEVKILASKAVEGGTLYVRQREIKSKEATATSAAIEYELASTYVTHLINYPSIPEIVDASYTFTKGGYSGAITFTAALNAAGKNPFETAIKNIKLGTKEIAFSTSTAVASGINTMTITLDASSLSTMTNCYSKPITITYMNGTVDKTSIKLTIQSPVAASALTVTYAKGTNTGTTAFTMVSSKAAENTWAYVITATEINNVYTLDKLADVIPAPATATTFTTTTVDNITVTADQYITIFEVDATGYIVKYKSIKIITDYIK